MIVYERELSPVDCRVLSLRVGLRKRLDAADVRSFETAAGRLRLIGMTACVRVGLAVLACGLLSGCAGTTEGGSDCVSHYNFVAGSPTWEGLKDAMLGYTERGRVASVRTHARGDDIGAGDQKAVRVVDLLNRNGRRLVQVDVWRTDARAWRAGIWSQCID
jgi:hypothetical protein